MHEIWRKARRPFRLAKCCGPCSWEVYDTDKAGCRRCGAQHVCADNPVDSVCPLETCEDMSRVCSITGYVLNEVRHAPAEYSANVNFMSTEAARSNVEDDVQYILSMMLSGPKAEACREKENQKLYSKLEGHMYKQLRLFKLRKPGVQPNLAVVLASALAQEKYWHFIEVASMDLIKACCETITSCIIELQRRNVKITPGQRVRDVVCGMLYMLKTGVVCKNRVILRSIPEVYRCLPHENKISHYFDISSKVICTTENEIKYIYRDET